MSASDSLFQFEYHPGGEIVIRLKSPRNLLPEAVQGHLESAGKEVLLALRDMLDKAIEKTEPPAEPKKASRIEVQ